MSDKIGYSVSRSSATEIAEHLLNVDRAFEPALSSRVEIPIYARKLHDRAFRFEAWLSGELVGLVACYCNQPDGGKAFVTSVSVSANCQGLGIAGQLMLQCIAHVRQLSFGALELEVDHRNLVAVAFYQKLGFKILFRSGSTLTMGMELGQKAL